MRGDAQAHDGDGHSFRKGVKKGDVMAVEETKKRAKSALKKIAVSHS